jgi:hypothetical protein
MQEEVEDVSFLKNWEEEEKKSTLQKEGEIEELVECSQEEGCEMCGS